MLEVKRLSNRLMIIKLQIDKRIVVVVSAYAPQQDLTTDEKDRFYESIIQLIASIKKKGMHGYHWWRPYWTCWKEVYGYDSVHLKHRG